MLRLFVLLTAQLARLRDWRDDRGMTTETAIITGLLAAAAIGAMIAIGGAIANRANSSADTIENGMALGVLL